MNAKSIFLCGCSAKVCSLIIIRWLFSFSAVFLIWTIGLHIFTACLFNLHNQQSGNSFYKFFIQDFFFCFHRLEKFEKIEFHVRSDRLAFHIQHCMLVVGSSSFEWVSFLIINLFLHGTFRSHNAHSTWFGPATTYFYSILLQLRSLLVVLYEVTSALRYVVFRLHIIMPILLSIHSIRFFCRKRFVIQILEWECIEPLPECWLLSFCISFSWALTNKMIAWHLLLFIHKWMDHPYHHRFIIIIYYERRKPYFLFGHFILFCTLFCLCFSSSFSLLWIPLWHHVKCSMWLNFTVVYLSADFPFTVHACCTRWLLVLVLLPVARLYGFGVFGL